MGPTQPGPGARQGRSPQADQLGAGFGGIGVTVTGGCLGGQGVRHRAGHRGLPVADGGAGHRGDPPPGFARRAAARTGRADAPGLPDPHLRRRHQRGATRHHRHGGPRPSPRQPLTNTGEPMDFSTIEAAQDLGGLVTTIVDAVCTPEHQRKLDGLDQRFDRELWSKLADADILSTAAPESLGGGGFGVLEEVAVLVGLGRQLAVVPYLESVVLAAGALARFGSAELQQQWGAPAVTGEKILTGALDGEMGDGPVQAISAGSGYKLTGTRTQIAYGPVADGFLVPAETDSGTAVFLVAANDPGVTVTALDTTGLGSIGHLRLGGVEVDGVRVVGGADVVSWFKTLELLGRSAFQLGVLERGLLMTAEYAREREQFDRPIGSFQAVGQRLADGYIDVKGLRLTLTQAAWRLSEDLPADTEVATAAFWAADAGHRVAHTIVHIHGGVGIDTDHPVHRYFLAAKQTEFALGGATGQLLKIGRELADTPA